MRKFIVVMEEYIRYGQGAPISVALHEAEDENVLVCMLEEELCADDMEDPADNSRLSPIERLAEANGDGINYYIIREIFPDWKLGPDLLEE